MRNLLLAMLFCLCLSSCTDKTGNAPEESEALNFTALGVDPDSFIEGNLFFLGYHELGHALVSELKLPITGREEDAVDRLAIWLMTPEKDEGEPDYLIGAMHGWFLTGAEVPLTAIDWWDEHGTDQQRGYQIACLLYGSDEEQFAKAAETARLPQDRLGSCVDEAAQNDDAWQKILGDHLRPDGEVAPESSITVRYDATKNYADDEDYLKKTGLLEDISLMMRTNYLLEPGITISGKECGEANSYWNPEARTLEICYELVTKFRDLAAEKS
jgi:Putative metallopeptidase